MHTNEPATSPEPGFTPTPAPAETERRQCGGRQLRTKLCAACALVKPRVAFRRATDGPDPHRNECRSCESRRAAATAAGIAPPVATLPPGCKQCRRCGEVRALTAFTHDARTRDSRAPVCRPCHAAARATRQGARLASLEEPDELLGMNTAEMEQRAALGIAIAHATCPPGHRRTRAEIAAYAGVSSEAIRLIEVNALRKVREQVSAILREAGRTLREVQL